MMAAAALNGCGVAPAGDRDEVSTERAALSGPTVTISGTVADAQFPQAGVTITLSGSAQGQVITDFSGTYAFTVASGGSYSITAAGTPNFFLPPFSSCLTFSPSIVNLNDLTTDTVVDILGAGTDVVTNCAPAEIMGATAGPLTISGVVSSGGAPVPGALVALNGSAQGTRVTDETGAYSFAVASGSYSLKVTGACGSFAPDVVNLNNVRSSKTQNFTGAACPPAPLALCPTLDADFGFSEPATCDAVTSGDCTFDRELGWVGAVTNDFLNINDVDCRFGVWDNPPIIDDFTSVTVIQWETALNTFALQLFGCALQGNLVGPLGFPMIPPVLASLHFTTADLAALQDEYVQGIQQALSDQGAPPLTTAQLAAINTQLGAAAARVPGVTRSSTLTYSTCP
ncbi:MAG TPA: carboxypeptidase regulatory-like domain-containing protein [Polyangia bacterium]|nr:carboxypeptidase regulatory-like domain-containing protein [Polyangia bacterium]